MAIRSVLIADKMLDLTLRAPFSRIKLNKGVRMAVNKTSSHSLRSLERLHGAPLAFLPFS